MADPASWILHLCHNGDLANIWTQWWSSTAYPEVLLQVVDGDGNVFAALLQLDVGEAGQREVQAQVLHGAAVHVQALQGLLQVLPRLGEREEREGKFYYRHKTVK